MAGRSACTLRSMTRVALAPSVARLRCRGVSTCRAAVLAGRGTRRGAGSRAKNEWVRRQQSDPFVKQAHEQGLRSRACFKLLQMNNKFRFLRPGMQVVDLGSAPGGWLQVAAQKVLHTRQLGAGACERVEAARATDGRRASAGGPATLEYGSDSDDAVSFLSLMAGGSGEDDGGTQPSPGVDDTGAGRGKLQRYQVVGVDLLPVAPVPGTLCLQGDFTDPHVRTRLLARMRRPKADAVLSDMAHSFLGHGSTDHAKQLDLAQHAFTFALRHLRWGGSLVMKALQGAEAKELADSMQAAFRVVHHVKPPASRGASAEFFLVGLGYRTNAKLLASRGVTRRDRDA